MNIELTLIIGSAVPLLVAVLNDQVWSNPVKQLAAFAATLAVAAVNALLQGPLTTEAFVMSFGLIYAASDVSYKIIWKPTQVAGFVERTLAPGGIVQSKTGVVIDATDVVH